MIRFFAPTAFARLSLVSNAFYFALLFIAANCNLTAYFNVSFSGDIFTTLASPIFLVADPSVWTVHVSIEGSSSL